MSDLNLSPALLAYAAARNELPPVHLGTRYTAVSGFLPEPGNTVVADVMPGTETESALIAARERFLEMPEAAQFIFTPISSLHMTLFQGIIESRRVPGYWPPDLPLDTPIDEMTARMGERMERLAPGDRFAVEAIGARPSGIIVAGASEADRAAIKAWRDALAEIWGYRHPDHESYVFHITFAYPRVWLEDETLPKWQAMLDTVTADIRTRAPVLELRPAAFCAFRDMNHFAPLRALPLR